AATIEENPSIFDPHEIACLRLDFALWDGDEERARALLHQGDRCGVFLNANRARWRRSFDLRLRQLTDRPLAPSEIEEVMADENDCFPVTGIRDTEAAAVFWSLSRTDVVSADRYMRRFLESRLPRCRTPLHHSLQAALNARSAERFGLSCGCE